MTKLEEVRTAVVRAVPEIGSKKWVCSGCSSQSFFQAERVHIFPCPTNGLVEETITPIRPIQLADVLRAIGKKESFSSPEYREALLHVATNSWSDNWNLAANLDEQEPSVIEFLHSILCV